MKKIDQAAFILSIIALFVAFLSLGLSWRARMEAPSVLSRPVLVPMPQAPTNAP